MGGEEGFRVLFLSGLTGVHIFDRIVGKSMNKTEILDMSGSE